MTLEDAAARQAVETVIRALNEAWTRGRIDDLVPLFHEQVVMLAPGGAQRMVGREEMLESFRQYTSNATTHRFRELGLEVDVFGSTAVATLKFQVRYEMRGQVYDEAGTDLFVLHRGSGDWQIVWRTQVPTAQETGS